MGATVRGVILSSLRALCAVLLVRPLRAVYDAWQPLAVFCGGVATATGLSGVAAESLGLWAAVAVAGITTLLGALGWGALFTIVEEPDQ